MKFFKMPLYFKFSLYFFFLAWATYGLTSFFSTYRLQSPVIFRSPIVKIKQEVLISPTASASAKHSYIFDLGKMADKIYQLESSGGVNDGCRSLGLYNGYGYAQSDYEWKCYGSHEEVRQLVISWLERHIKNGDIESALCYYNRGVEEKGCRYAINFLNL